MSPVAKSRSIASSSSKKPTTLKKSSFKPNQDFKFRSQVSSSRTKFQVQESSHKFNGQVTSPIVKRGQGAHLLPANLKREVKKPSTRGQEPNPISHQHDHHQVSIPSPQAAAAPQQPENPETNLSQGSSLSPVWVHGITNLMDIVEINALT